MGKKTKLALAGIGVLLAALMLAVWLWILHPARPVGFELTRTKDAAGQAFPIAVWYPTTSTPWPTTLIGNALVSVAKDGGVDGKQLGLIVLSHGNGGGVGSHIDLAVALAAAGYVVATPMHPGDNLQDSSAISRPDFFALRADQVQATIGHMLEHWGNRDAIDQGRVGVYGFSAGGAAALMAAGATPDLSRIASRCAEAAGVEFVCQVLKQAGSPLLQPGAKVDAADPRAGRVRALVLAAPGLGFTMDGQALAAVDMPVQLWSGQADSTVPYESNARPLREALGKRVDYREVPGAGHLSFLAPCRLFGPPAICADRDGFDRGAFHARMNRDVVAFFDQHLRRK
jgi:predicted dienelactone hydrolase